MGAELEGGGIDTRAHCDGSLVRQRLPRLYLVEGKGLADVWSLFGEGQRPLVLRQVQHLAVGSCCLEGSLLLSSLVVAYDDDALAGA